MITPLWQSLVKYTNGTPSTNRLSSLIIVLSIQFISGVFENGDVIVYAMREYNRQRIDTKHYARDPKAGVWQSLIALFR